MRAYLKGRGGGVRMGINKENFNTEHVVHRFTVGVQL
jgi:hypothetical protein